MVTIEFPYLIWTEAFFYHWIERLQSYSNRWWTKRSVGTGRKPPLQICVRAAKERSNIANKCSVLVTLTTTMWPFCTASAIGLSCLRRPCRLHNSLWLRWTVVCFRLCTPSAAEPDSRRNHKWRSSVALQFRMVSQCLSMVWSLPCMLSVFQSLDCVLIRHNSKLLH